MKLKVVKTPGLHQKTVTAVAWTPGSQIYAVSDDRTISVWNASGEVVNKNLVKIEEYVTDMDWLPQVGTQASSQFVIGCTSGRFYILSKVSRNSECHEEEIVYEENAPRHPHSHDIDCLKILF